MIGSEGPVQAKVVEFLASIGWTPMSRREMHGLRSGRMGEPLVEPLLIDALRELNEGLTEQEALQVVDHLRRISDSETFLEVIRDGVKIAFSPEESAQDVVIVDWHKPSRNGYVVTTEFELKTGAIREPRLDVVCLVNGIPLGVIETKAFDEDWKRAAKDFKEYWVDAPELEKFAAVCVATNGFKFRCAPSGATRTSQYAEWKDTWPHRLNQDERELEIGLLGVLDPHTLADIAANFVVFETRKGVTTKKLARYQQFRGANKLVKRVVDGDYDRGIIWHTQGSGKSLTMLFAARKLKNVGLGNPTILIVIDRVDLDQQINETFTASSFKGVAPAVTGPVLRDMLANDRRGVIITTVQKFNEETNAVVDRDNVIVLVDEAHRTHLGQSLYGIRMRAALPKAKLFAFTGTPIETNDRSTRKAFSPVIDGEYENYLDIYTPRQAVEDRATVEVRYEPRLAEWNFSGDDLDDSFSALADDLTDEEQERVKSDAARLGVVAKAPQRIQAISADVAGHLRTRTIPQGFKAQLVAIDREACAIYANEMLAQGFAPEEIAVVFTPRPKADGAELRRWWASEQWKRRSSNRDDVDEQELLLDDETELSLDEARARKNLIEAFKDDRDPLKLLIVCDMLLTGFDAPIEEVMFLDKPLKGAKLLQAIMRTNRPLPSKRKSRGIIVDYWGVFERLQEAFAEFDPGEVDLAVLDMRQLRENFPVLLAEALALVAGMPETAEYEQMMWLRWHFMEDKEAAERFEERFQAAQSAFESLAPDPALAPHLEDYRRLVRLRALWRHSVGLDEADADFDLDEYRPQTYALVQDAVSAVRLRTDLPVYRIDGSYAERIKNQPGSPEEKAAEVEAAIEFEIRQRGEHDPVARSLAERLEKLKEKKKAEDRDMLALLNEQLELASDWAKEKEAAEALGLSRRAQGFLSVAKGFEEASGLTEEDLIELAKRLDEIVEKNATFPDWADRDDVRRDIRKQMIMLLRAEPTKPLLGTSFVDELITVATARDVEETSDAGLKAAPPTAPLFRESR